jgi:hypothetical protein
MKPAKANQRLRELLLLELLFSQLLTRLTQNNKRTITVQLPLLQNANKFGIRIPTKPSSFRETFRELKAMFSGFNVSIVLGWCKEDGMWDPHLRIDLDAEITTIVAQHLLRWQEVLCRRFRQHSIHMTCSSPVRWIGEAFTATKSSTAAYM